MQDRGARDGPPGANTFSRRGVHHIHGMLQVPTALEDLNIRISARAWARRGGGVGGGRGVKMCERAHCTTDFAKSQVAGTSAIEGRRGVMVQDDCPSDPMVPPALLQRANRVRCLGLDCAGGF
jgi:hypothetical protein